MQIIKQKKRERVNQNTLLCTVDLGKVKNSGYFRLPDGSHLKTPFFFENNRKGFDLFWGRINGVKEKNGLKEILVGYESTGNYGEPLIHFLRNQGASLVQTNPMHTKRYKEVVDNTPNKSDLKDPLIIADIIEMGRYLNVIIPEGTTADLRRFVQVRERQVKDRTALLNQLEKLVHAVFPEFLQLMELKTKSALHLLKHYPFPEDIVELGLEKLTEELRKASHGNLKRVRAEMLYDAARDSVGIQEGREGILYRIRLILAELANKEKSIREIEERLEEDVISIPYSKYILSIKGIGLISLAKMMGEVGDFKQYRRSEDIEKLAGLNLCVRMSGKYKGQTKISKMGRGLLRTTLYFCALGVIKWNPIFKKYYEDCLQRGMVRVKALIAVSRKLLKVIFALVRDEVEYDSNYGMQVCS